MARSRGRGYTPEVSVPLLLVLALAATARASSSESVTFEALKGDWLHPAYVATLRRTRSNDKTYKLAKYDGPVWLEFKGDAKGLSLNDYENFHEGPSRPCGALELTPAAGGAYSAKCSGRQEFATLRLVDGALEWRESAQEPAVRYVRVRGSVANFAAATALSGSYRDETGASLDLRRDGTARWAGRELASYSINVDAAYAGRDTLYMGGESWLYELTKDGLELWTMKEDENGFDQPDKLAHTLVRR